MDKSMAPPTYIRETVRSLLLASPAFAELDPPRRRALAQSMVQVSTIAAALIEEELKSDHSAQRTATPLARAQSAGSEFSGVSATKVAGTTRAILNAVSFPRFVTELINGVFKAMLDSSLQQMQSYVELLNNVAASAEGFADTNLGDDRARAWLAERYPASFQISGDTESDEPPDPDTPAERSLQLRPDASFPSPEALRTDLGLGPDDSIPTGDPERTLVPLARRRLAQMRQSMLATMVMLGMQRIVIESGRVQAAMRFHIDTRSAAQADQGSTFDFRNTTSGAGSFGIGAWGVSASMTNTIGYVTTQRSQSTEELNTDLELTSSVELNFKSDYLPLNRMASSSQTQRIMGNSLNPDAEFAEARNRERERRTAQQASENQRDAATVGILKPPSIAAPVPGSPGTVGDAERARREAAERERKKTESKSAKDSAASKNAKTDTKSTKDTSAATKNTKTDSTATKDTSTDK